MRLSHEANGTVTNKRVSRGKTARAVWHRRSAGVARQRCSILRDGNRGTGATAVGCKAINSSRLKTLLCRKRIILIRLTNGAIVVGIGLTFHDRLRQRWTQFHRNLPSQEADSWRPTGLLKTYYRKAA